MKSYSLLLSHVYLGNNTEYMSWSSSLLPARSHFENTHEHISSGKVILCLIFWAYWEERRSGRRHELLFFATVSGVSQKWDLKSWKYVFSAIILWSFLKFYFCVCHHEKVIFLLLCCRLFENNIWVYVFMKSCPLLSSFEHFGTNSSVCHKKLFLLPSPVHLEDNTGVHIMKNYSLLPPHVILKNNTQEHVIMKPFSMLLFLCASWGKQDRANHEKLLSAVVSHTLLK